MASPFRVFRKHMKALLVVFGVALMLVFVLGDPLTQYFRNFSNGGTATAARDAGAVAVRWDGGELTNAELAELVTRRRVLNAFLRQIIQEGAYVEQYQAVQTGVAPRPLRVRSLLGPELPAQGVEQSIVRVRIFSEAAAKTGMSVDDEMIGRYLDDLGRGHVTRDMMQAMLSRVQMGRGGNVTNYVFAALREELLADYYMAGHEFALVSVMPQQRWQDWLRVNDRVVVEALPRAAEQFLAQVPDPSPTVLTEYYDLYKEFEPLPRIVDNTELPSPTPGFKIPRKVAVQYVRADFNQLLERIKAELTEEEIQKYYDENKNPYFIKPDTSLIDEMTEKTTEEVTTDETTADESEAVQEADETERIEVDEVDGQSETAGAAGAGGDEQPTTPSDGVDRQTPAGAGDTATPIEDNVSASQRTLPQAVFRLAAFGQEAVGSAGASQVDQERTNADQPAEDTQQPAENATPAADSNEVPAADAAGQPGAEQSATEQPAADEKPIEYQPLDEVRDQIRESLATPKVNDRLDELVLQLRGQLTAEFNKYFAAKTDAEYEGKPLPAVPPALADLSGLAEQHGLEYRKTDPLSWLEMRDDEALATLYDVDRATSLIGALHDKDLELYKPIVASDLDNNRYVATKLSDTDSRVPPLEEIRDEVARSWRLAQASELALKAAEELAEKSNATGLPLSEYIAENPLAAADMSAADTPATDTSATDDGASETDAAETEAAKPTTDVVRTDAFAWLTGGDVAMIGGGLQQQPFRLSQPDGIVAAGPDFMRTVFDLDVGRAAGVLNHDHSMAYVVQLVEHQLGEEELRSDYLAEANFWPGRRLMDSFHAQESATAVASYVLEQANVDWVRDPDPRDGEE